MGRSLRVLLEDDVGANPLAVGQQLCLLHILEPLGRVRASLMAELCPSRRSGCAMNEASHVTPYAANIESWSLFLIALFLGIAHSPPMVQGARPKVAHR